MDEGTTFTTTTKSTTTTKNTKTTRGRGDLPLLFGSWLRNGRSGGLALILVAAVATIASAQEPALSVAEGAVPKLSSSVLPVFPPTAVSDRREGIVIARLTVAPDGRVAGALILRGLPLLDAAVLAAVRQWTFAPTGKEVTVEAVVQFVLSSVPVSHDPPTSSVVSWPPPDFAVYYFYACTPEVAVIIDSLQAVIHASAVSPAMSPLALSAEDKERLSLELVQAGFFARPDATTQREARATIREVEGRIRVVVPGHAAPVNVSSSSGEPRRSHELMARTYGVWRILRWSEPVPNDDAAGREAVRIGQAVRDFIRTRVQDRSQREALVCRS